MRLLEKVPKIGGALMNFGPLIFLGIFFTMSLSWLGLVLGPNLQLGGNQPEPNDKTGQLYPQAPSGIAHQGAEIYRANGCFYCHSQQVAPKNSGYDSARGWGERRTVADDYLFDSPVMTGLQRVGPDLANIGLRQLDDNQLLLHLYNPQITMLNGKKSNMPSFPYLFEERKIGRMPSPDALKFPAHFSAKAGYEIVPKAAAKQLVAYLRSLQSSTPLFELPSLTPSTNKVETTNASPANATNAATAANTNAPATTNLPAK
jgi:cytochrome c oxidase cbb3-type subunit 2